MQTTAYTILPSDSSNDVALVVEPMGYANALILGSIVRLEGASFCAIAAYAAAKIRELAPGRDGGMVYVAETRYDGTLVSHKPFAYFRSGELVSIPMPPSLARPPKAEADA